MSKRLFSSAKVTTALERGGFTLDRQKGSHGCFVRERPSGGHDLVVIPLGEREIPKGTLQAALKTGNVDYEEFLSWTKVKRKGRRK